MDETMYFLFEGGSGVVMATEYDMHDYSGRSSEPADWYIPNRQFNKAEAIEICDIINALVDDGRSRGVLMKRLLLLV